ncbi:(2Fe-2S) ferredoxin domain-containing protein [Spirochaetia bacterium 38H-sp]|uniref:(2Fe-2S) ferredoxin domain-containing protein n=1 Tax=Rarispira pelagica TaxID=3141764 RepID=A0ABU9UC05_9SPIR
MNKERNIIVCMGSSCHSRGNAFTVKMISTWLKEHGLNQKIEVKGELCSGRCKEGPVVRIGSRIYEHVQPEAIPDILSFEFPEEK